MKTFVPTGFVTEPSLSSCLAATAWLNRVIAEAPENFRRNGGDLGPTLVLPVFIQKMVIRSGSVGISTEGFNNINKRLIRYNGYNVVPGYEFAVILFFPDQAPVNGNAIYRVDFTQTNFLPDGKE